MSALLRVWVGGERIAARTTTAIAKKLRARGLAARAVNGYVVKIAVNSPPIQSVTLAVLRSKS